MKKSRFNPESPANITADSARCTSTMKRSESASTLQATDTSISLIEDRYRLLEQDYRSLLRATKSKGELFRKQKLDLEYYRSQHLKNSREI
jgi:hypothetical protein